MHVQDVDARDLYKNEPYISDNLGFTSKFTSKLFSSFENR